MLFLLRRTPVKTLKHLPKFLPIDDDFKNTELISDDEHEKLRLAVLDVKNQLFVETATWGLSDWERVLGISVKENAGIEDRRIQILLKLQGLNTVSETFMNNLINMFCEDKSGYIIQHNPEYWFEVVLNIQILLKLQGLNTVSETFMNNLINMFCEDKSGYIIQHNPEYWFEVVLNGNQKLDLDSLSDAIETYKPAHLGYIYSVNIALDNRRYIGSKIGSLRSYYLEPKTMDDTVVNPKQYRLGKISNIKYMDIDMAGIITEVNIDNKKYMLANTGQLRETNISIDNFIKPLDFDVKINYARSFNLYKVNDIDLNSLNKVDVNVNNTALAKATSLKEYEIKMEDET